VILVMPLKSELKAATRNRDTISDEYRMIYYKISKEIFTQVKFFRQKAELKDSAMHVSSHTSCQSNLLKKGNS